MATAIDLVFRYGRLLSAALIMAWSVYVALSRRRLTRRLLLALVPIVLALPILWSVVFPPLVVTSPATHVLVHPGDAVTVRVKMRPALLADVYQAVALDLYRCYVCVEPPPGVSYSEAREGADFVFVVKLPADLPDGEIYLNAFAKRSLVDEHPAMRSEGIGLVVRR